MSSIAQAWIRQQDTSPHTIIAAHANGDIWAMPLKWCEYLNTSPQGIDFRHDPLRKVMAALWQRDASTAVLPKQAQGRSGQDPQAPRPAWSSPRWRDRNRFGNRVRLPRDTRGRP